MGEAFKYQSSWKTEDLITWINNHYSGLTNLWQVSTDQTLLTGDKSGSFDLITTGDITCDTLNYTMLNPPIPTPTLDSVLTAGDTSATNNLTLTAGTLTSQRIEAVDWIGIANGSAGAPSIRFTSDGDTGIYRKNTNQFGFTAGGTNSMWLGMEGLTIAGVALGSNQYTLNLGNNAQHLNGIGAYMFRINPSSTARYGNMMEIKSGTTAYNIFNKRGFFYTGQGITENPTSQIQNEGETFLNNRLVAGDTIIADTTSLGSEMITNGTFNSDISSWTCADTTWAYGTNDCRKAASSGTATLSQALVDMVTPIEVGKTYLLYFTLASYNGPENSLITVSCGGYSYQPLDSGVHKLVFKATTLDPLTFTPNATATRVYLDNVSLKEITDGDLDVVDDLNVYGAGYFGDKISFTQTDGAEKIDSDADGDLDYYAGTSHDFIIGSTEQITLTDGKLAPTTDNDIDLGDSTHQFKSLYLAPASLYLGTTKITENSYNRNELNMMLAHFKLSVVGGLAKYNLVDGIMDEYEDETGVDTTNSTYEVYNSVGDYYSPLQTGGGTAPTSHWLFNENAASTDVADTRSANPGTASHNTSDLHVTGKINGAFAFTGSGDHKYVDCGTDASLDLTDTWTIALWIRNTDLGNGRYVITRRVPATSDHYCVYSGSNNKYRLYTDNNASLDLTLTTAISDTDWHHVAFTYDGTTEKGYLDGTEDATQDVSTAFTGTGGNMMLGGVSDYSASDFVGELDDIRIYNGTCLDATAIAALYNSGDGTEADGGTATIEDMTLISNAQTAEAAPSQGRIVIFEEDVDAITLNTDLKAYVSRDGTNYTQLTLTDEGDYGTGQRILTGIGTITSASGTTMKYKIETLNAKNLKLHGVGLQWD